MDQDALLIAVYSSLDPVLCCRSRLLNCSAQDGDELRGV